MTRDNDWIIAETAQDRALFDLAMGVDETWWPEYTQVEGWTKEATEGYRYRTDACPGLLIRRPASACNAVILAAAAPIPAELHHF